MRDGNERSVLKMFIRGDPKISDSSQNKTISFINNQNMYKEVPFLSMEYNFTRMSSTSDLHKGLQSLPLIIPRIIDIGIQ